MDCNFLVLKRRLSYATVLTVLFFFVFFRCCRSLFFQNIYVYIFKFEEIRSELGCPSGLRGQTQVKICFLTKIQDFW